MMLRRLWSGEEPSDANYTFVRQCERANDCKSRITYGAAYCSPVLERDTPAAR